MNVDLDAMIALRKGKAFSGQGVLSRWLWQQRIIIKRPRNENKWKICTNEI